MDQVRKGGGTKKVLYTLNTIRKIGIAKSAKALTAKNTCKACALGMGGQLGGMTNEVGEFPSVCNKSVQAQSTDIQPEIPEEVFAHTLEEFRELSPRETEKLGRLGFPLHKPLGEDRFRRVSWEFALGRASRKLRETSPTDPSSIPRVAPRTKQLSYFNCSLAFTAPTTFPTAPTTVIKPRVSV